MKNSNARKDVLAMAKKAKSASLELSLVSTSVKNIAIRSLAKAIKDNTEYLKKENNKDIVFAEKQGYSKALIDRLLLDDKRVQGMVKCLLDIAKLKDPVGDVIASFKRPNGLNIKKVRTPIGVIGIIYESRPNVASDCIGLCLKSGNAVILKGGKEAFYSNKAIFSVMKNALKKTKIPADAIQLVDSADRAAVNVLLGLNDHVDLIVPRGGESLIRFVAENSTIPVIKHYKGVCHTYVSNKADLEMARAICFNAKVQRPGVCNAMETMLVHKGIAKKYLPEIVSELLEAGVEIRGCKKTKEIIKSAKLATEQDWKEEYLDLILSVKVVDDVKHAIEHVNKYGSQHSDAIITNDKKEADIFLRSVDSACLYVNASTRFTDGYEFGFGAEIGISTDKLHARGPMALEELTTYKYMVYGQGQIRQ
ncbi:MAG: glutamate-5-semialdehyde dehydrogenase [Omnitrophica WOR_2 bacterium GWF2_38_59]|nr:MAG: glutamate-5-semialdehyde dehydrogenase [Omnitrophica WOR_2 bacterium GWF2_38_59]OGX47931.1 MAG: glutamate-5-semialdehyde dehydrogenase [Omnitrophica WOR_2 bacterium RIFOXYA2_FULL_38_17]OGX52421.1 MAG: glutamate-5-semialdehyde dehydrogenase [Omnitrophica WOR_2 bacterium RIFOXYA12_FULL_38_10]OGX56268.1 MAG: glutamate-5-semialdehyde dehydrogenase [Omnitrophica WOR_2 bacterium RIFOXYC2_FULL_38_12]OGX60227.1 MAG: glutamate-5-semialdehyde dehydrogenase [Omnitrophica WOR_2 bacterium RIFOXYB2_F